MPQVWCAVVVPLVRAVCRFQFPGRDYREFLGYIWERFHDAEPNLTAVRSAMLDQYRVESGCRRRLRIVYCSVQPSGLSPRYYRPDGEYEARTRSKNAAMMVRRIEADPTTVVGVDALAKESSFDPHDYLGRADTKPSHLLRSTCRGCGVRYAPGGVCGYCRARLVALKVLGEPPP